MVGRGRLSIRFVALGVSLLVLALVSLALTMWVTRQLDGGAAAVNEAGRLRMQAWRLTSAAQAAHAAQDRQAWLEEFERSLTLLRHGDRHRPLGVPWNTESRLRFARMEVAWQTLRPLWAVYAERRISEQTLSRQVQEFVQEVDALVLAMEREMVRKGALLSLCQFVMMALAVVGAMLALYIGYLFVVAPLHRLRDALRRIQAGDFGARMVAESHDEFAELSKGFNHMAEHLHALYHGLEQQVEAKTQSLSAQRERLQVLYEVGVFMIEPHTMESLAQGFAERVRRYSGADAVAVRWSDEASQRYLLLASDALPPELVLEERCIEAGLCACGQPQATARTRVIPIVSEEDHWLGGCAKAGYTSLVSVPIRSQQRVLGEVDLFFHQETTLTLEDRTLFDTLAGHLASALDNLRHAALLREAAVSEERTLLARELHDSIAQSLSFLKIQASLLRRAMQEGDRSRSAQVLDELDEGLRESTNDVRELLVHFRTRTNVGDMEQALRITLQKFEHQSGLRSHLQMEGHAVDLPSDTQLQVLHVLQEALSNVRKHAHASEVWVMVERAPRWRFSVRDNGAGFEPRPGKADDTHVGLHIMQERAQRIGGRVLVRSSPGQGTEVSLELQS